MERSVNPNAAFRLCVHNNIPFGLQPILMVKPTENRSHHHTRVLRKATPSKHRTVQLGRRLGQTGPRPA